MYTKKYQKNLLLTILLLLVVNTSHATDFQQEWRDDDDPKKTCYNIGNTVDNIRFNKARNTSPTSSSGLKYWQLVLGTLFLLTEGTYSDHADDYNTNYGGIMSPNSYNDTSNQTHPRMSGIIGSNDFVTCWNNQGAHDISCQILDSSGNKIGQQFRANTNNVANDETTDIVPFSNSNWATVFKDENTKGIRGQVFSQAGQKQPNEYIIIDPVAQNSIGKHSSSSLQYGTLMAVVWLEGTQGLNNIYGEIWDGSGNNITGRFKVNNRTITQDDSTQSISVDGLKPGGFVTAWTNNDGNSSVVYATIIDNNGIISKLPFKVNIYPYDDQYTPFVRGQQNGKFVITWVSVEKATAKYDVYAQIFHKNGEKYKNKFLVNEDSYDVIYDPFVTTLSDDAIVIGWTSYNHENSTYDIWTQIFNKKGKKKGPLTRFNKEELEERPYPSIANTTNHYVIVWQNPERKEGYYDSYFTILFQFNDGTGEITVTVEYRNQCKWTECYSKFTCELNCYIGNIVFLVGGASSMFGILSSIYFCCCTTDNSRKKDKEAREIRHDKDKKDIENYWSDFKLKCCECIGSIGTCLSQCTTKVKACCCCCNKSTDNTNYVSMNNTKKSVLSQS